MGKQQDNIGNAYNLLKAKNSDIPDIGTFRKDMQDPIKREQLHGLLSKDYPIPDFNTFSSDMGFVEKKNPNVPTVSYGLGVSTASKGRPISQNLVADAFNKATPIQPVKPNVKPKEKGSQILERTGSALSTLGKSFIDGVIATSAEQVAILAKNIDDEGRELVGMSPLKKPIEEYQTYKWAKQIMASTEETFKPNPEFKGEIQEQVAQTAGDLLGLVATAFITKNPSSALSKLGTKGLIKAMGSAATRNVVMKEVAKGAVKMAASPTAFLGAAQSGTRAFDKTIQDGGTEEQANAMYWSTAVTGAVANSLPIGGLLSRFDKASGGTMKQMVVGGVVGGIEEAVTEGIEQISTNFAAQNIYDETRKLFEGVGESTAMGGGLGFVLNAFGVKLGAIRNKFKDNPQKLAEIDDSVEYIKGIAEKEAQLSAIKLSKEEQVKVDKYTAIVNDPNADENVKDIAKEKIQEINGSKIIEAESVQEKMNNLSEDDAIEVKLIDAEIEKTKTAISNSTDVEIRDELDRQLGILGAEKELLLNKSKEAEAQASTQSGDAQEGGVVETVATEEPTSLRGVKYSDIVVGDKRLEDILSDNKLNEEEKWQVRDIFARGVDYFKFDKEGEQKFQEKFANPEDITDVADIINGVSTAQQSAFDLHNTKNYENVKDAVNFIANNPQEYSPKVVNVAREIKSKLDNPSSSMSRLYAVDIIKELGFKAQPTQETKGKAEKPTAFDFDGTLMDNTTGKLTPLGEEVKQRIANGEDISIVTAREANNIEEIKQSLGIKEDNIHATGDESLKGETIDGLGIDRNSYFDADTQKLDNIRSGTPPPTTPTDTNLDSQEGQPPKRKPLYDGLDANNKRSVVDSLSDTKKTEKALEDAKQFQPKEVEALLKPEVGETASYTVSRKNKPIVLETEVVDIDLESGKATIKDEKGVDKEIAIDKLFKTPKQVAEQYHKNLPNGTNEGLLNAVEGAIVKDVSDEVINKQRRMSAPIKADGGIRKLISKLPLPLQKFYNNWVSSGSRDAVRALEAKDSFMAEKRDRLAAVTKKLVNSVKGSNSLRALANKVISHDMIGDKIDSFTNKTTPEAISALTGIDKDKIESAYKNPKDPESVTTLQEMNDTLASLTEDGTKGQINKIIQEEIVKDKTQVRTLAARWMNPDSKKNVDDNGTQLTREDIEAEILKLENGQEIVDALKKSKVETDKAKTTLLDSEKGKKVLAASIEARDLIDEFSSWADENIAGLKIKNKSIGDRIAENVGFYMKKTYDHWTNKDFSFDQATQKDAVDSMIQSILPIRLGNLVNTKGFIDASDKVKERLIKNLTEKTAKDAEMAFAKYISEVTSDKEFGTTTASSINSKVASKNLLEKQFMNEHFEKVLGKNADAIERLNATVTAQAQVQGAAEMGRILNDLAGDTFFSTREEGIQKMMEGGLSAMEAGEKFGLEYREVKDRYSVNDGQFIPIELYKVIYEELKSIDFPLLSTIKAMTSVWRLARTVYNIPAGHVTNALGGHIAIAEQGHFVDDKTIKFLLDRFRLMGGSSKISPEGQALKKLMVDTGIWGTSVNLSDIELILKHSKADANGNFDKRSLVAVKKAFEKSGGGIKRYYSATDDFTKLILAEKKKDSFANKLYGKNWDELSTKEQAITFANIAERVKQNLPTSSRLPKFAKALIGSVIAGDFQGFRFGAFTSFFNTQANAIADIMQGLNDKSLSKEQKKAYLSDGIRTLTASATIFSVDKIYAAKMAALTGVAIGAIAKGAKGVFDEEKDNEDDSKSIGSKFDFYEGLKNSFFMPEYFMGQNLIVVADDGKGKLKLMNMSNTFGNDESYKLFTGQKNLPIFSLDKNKDTAITTSFWDTFTLNGMIEMFRNAIKGVDAWGKPIDNRFTYIAKEMIPPAFKRVYDLATRYAKDQVGEAPKDGSLDTREISAINMIKGMALSSPEAIKRTYDLDLNKDVFFRTKNFFKDNSTRYKNLSDEDKVLRIRKLEPMRNAYLELKKYEQLSGYAISADGIFNDALKGKASKEEIKYVKTGEKPSQEESLPEIE